MSRARVCTPLLLVLAVSLLAGCAVGRERADPATPLEAMEPVVLTLSESGSQRSIFGVGWDAFAAEVERRSQGKITVETYWDGSLLSATEALGGLSSGVADLGSLSINYFDQELPVGNWIAGIGAPVTENVRASLLGGSAAAFQYVRHDPGLTEEMDDHNLVALGAVSSTAQTLACVDPVRSVADAAGKRTRTGGLQWQAEAAAMGMVPVSLPLSEIYESLQRGVVDCVMMAPNTIQSYGFAELAKHITLLPLTAQQGNLFAMNRDAWEALPIAAREILHDSAYTLLAAATGKVMENTYDFSADSSGWGVQFHPSPELSGVVRAHQARAVSELPAEAPRSQADPAAVVRDYAASLDHWTDVALTEVPATADPWAGLAEADASEFWERVRGELGSAR